MIVAFGVMEDGENIPVGYRNIGYHMIFDVNQDVTRKSRLVSEGYRNTDVSPHAAYSSVVSRESVCVGFLLAALTNLDIFVCDIGNAYLNAPNCKNYMLSVRKIYSTQLILENAP